MKQDEIAARQRRIFELAEQGLDNAVIAERVGVDIATVQKIRARGTAIDAPTGLSGNKLRVYNTLRLAGRALMTSEVAEEVERKPRYVFKVLEDLEDAGWVLKHTSTSTGHKLYSWQAVDKSA